MGSAQIVPEMFETNSSFGPPLCPQQRNHFAENDHPRRLADCLLQGARDNAPEEVGKQRRIEAVLPLESGKSFGRVQGNKPALCGDGGNVYATRFQLAGKSFSVLHGGDDDRCVTCSQSGADEAAQLIQEEPIILIKPYAMPTVRIRAPTAWAEHHGRPGPDQDVYSSSAPKMYL